MNAMCGTHCGLIDKIKCNNIFICLKGFLFFVIDWIQRRERFSGNHTSKCKYSTEFITAIFFV